MQLFTSESVTEGHPDKVCDRISDSILDALLEQDPKSRVAVETLATKGLIHVVGEVTTEAYVEIPEIVRRELEIIGYTSSEVGFDARSCGVCVSIGQQSSDIEAAVNSSLEQRLGQNTDELDLQGAGDQGLMFGYACDETPDLMPAPIWLSHRLAQRLTQVRKDGIVEGFYPDGKTQVTLAYDGDRPVAVRNVLVSTQHSADLQLEQIQELVAKEVIDPVLQESGLDLDLSEVTYQVNPSGKFVIGGPAGDAGLTGRKIIVDTYGGMARHGGGAFSGKDPSKVDRSASYAMRWIAKNLVAAGIAKRVELQVSYAIGSSHPVSLWVNSYGTGVIPDAQIAELVRQNFDLRPAAIVRDLDLLRPIYAQTAAYGHFGRPGLPWEETNRVEALRAGI
ncbi:methionine adenosyltransferase [Boudabousia liubingyangii]|uniref:S-adenosylmethionine synthase n=1 Tax=Boudabousia liubingyangii TaxID=1921764 RepID=A0A1Q5PNN0_9ACTO|nr:methionine adenosyltransferase [Boudabousia liubingyangii]OKL47691.1 methionine adenosyltransferase [Boudabousia liubingyangii]OKL49117.1 methionine adenosyltransferase [Boudabousia liubingyangii]